MTRERLLIICVAVLALVVGVVSMPRRDGSGRVQVSGTVLLNGEPLEAAPGSNVGFFPAEAAGGGPLAGGLIGTRGRYRIGTFAPGDGVLPGTYRVKVSAWKNQPDRRDDVYEQTLPPSAVPERYADAHTSDLMIEVSRERSQTIDIRLVN